MKISQLLDELNISLDTLKSFEKKLNCEFLFLDQIVSDGVVEKLKEIFKKNKQETEYKKLSGPKISGDKIDLSQFNNSSGLRKRRRVPKKGANSLTNERRLKFLKGLYYNETCYKLEAKVKWYYNHARGLNEGYLVCNGLPDIYFKGEVVKGVNPRKLRENDEVLVEIPLKDLENRTKISASKVNKLEDENDLVFLVYQSIEAGNRKYFNQTLEQIKTQSDSIKKDTRVELQAIVESFTKNKLSSIFQIIFLYEFCDLASIDLLEELTKKSTEKFNLKEQFVFWLNTSVSFSFSVLKESIVNHLLTTENHSFLNKLKDDEIAIVLNEALTSRLTTNTNSKHENLVALLNSNQAHGIEIDYSKFSDQQLFLFWNNNNLAFSPIDAIFKKIVELWSNNSKSTLDQIVDIFDKATEQELKDLFSKIHFNKNQVKHKDEFNFVRLFIDNIKPEELTNEFFKAIYVKSPDYIKMQWFILEYTNELDYHSTVIYTAFLTPEMQKLYFKKVLMLIETKQLNLSLNDLNKITTIDYQTSEYAKEIDGVGLDFTLSVILKIVTDLSQNIKTSRNTIFEIIANQIRRPDDLLVIDGFFEKCSGRTILKVHEPDILDKDDQETTYSIEQKEYYPRFSTFCDGRKAVIKDTGEPSLCRKSGFEFWWCENSQCYNACRNQHDTTDWKAYTLEDVLRILNINYDNRQYEIFLNVVNRVNRFLEHLKCRSCETILRPRKQSNYAFYGVTKFYCNNDLCEENQKDIYLSHCLNGECEDIIDSRDSVRCINEGHGVECGWYICDYCYACCSSEKLKGRKYILERTGQEYKCHVDGHLNRGIICCPECGNETKEVGGSKELYELQLNWFIEHKDTHQNIINSGTRNDGKHWFLWAQGNFTFQQYRNQLKSMLKSGFNIPDYASEYKDTQLVAEPFNEIGTDSEVFNCPKCEHVINLKDKENFDFHRIKAIKSFHTGIFPTFNVQD